MKKQNNFEIVKDGLEDVIEVSWIEEPSDFCDDGKGCSYRLINA